MSRINQEHDSSITLQSSWHGPAFESMNINKNDTYKLRKQQSQRREQEKCLQISALQLSSNKHCPTNEALK
jgi:hypothetical protein